MDLRCEEGSLHGRLSEVDGRTVLEVSCRSAFCKGPERAVVLHLFDIETGKLLKTNRYKDPGKESHGLGQRTAVRHA